MTYHMLHVALMCSHYALPYVTCSVDMLTLWPTIYYLQC